MPSAAPVKLIPSVPPESRAFFIFTPLVVPAITIDSAVALVIAIFSKIYLDLLWQY